MKLRDTVGVLTEPQSHHGHVEHARGSPLVVFRTQFEHIVHLDAGKHVRGEVPADQVGLEPIDSSRDRGVRSENSARTHDLESLLKRESFTDQIGDPFQTEETGVTFVGVEDLRSRTPVYGVPRLEGPDAADTEQKLLEKPVLAAAAVEAIGDRAESVVVVGNVGIEEEEGHAPNGCAPQSCVERTPVGKSKRDPDGRPVRVADDRQRKPVGIENRIGLELPAVGGDRLGEVSGAVEEADPDQGNAKIRSAFQVVARKDAQAPRILRKGGSDAEFGREVCDARRRLTIDGLVPARLADVMTQIVPDLVDPVHETLVRSEFVESLRAHRTEQRDRIEPTRAPQLGRDLREDFTSRLMPRPAEIGGQLLQRGKLIGKHGADGEPADCFHHFSLEAGRGSRTAPHLAARATRPY